MKITSLLAVLAVSLLVFAAACSKDSEDCVFKAPDMVFVGYSEAATDTIIYRRYENNGQFNNLLDTILVANTNIKRQVIGKDSVVLFPMTYPDFGTNFYTNNWELYLPATKQSIRISDIVPVFNQQREAGSQCHSYVSSVVVNQQLYTYTSWFGSGYRIYVHRQ